MLPFMAVELLLSTTDDETTPHSEKHDLESFFYVLLYICTLYEGPGKLRSDINRSDSNHPFGDWINEAPSWHAIAAYRIAAFDSDAMKTRVLIHVHPYFNPLIPMLINFCNAVFTTYTLPGSSARMRDLCQPYSTHQGILDVLRSAYDTLPDDDLPGGPPTQDPPTYTIHTVLGSACSKTSPVTSGNQCGAGRASWSL
jgi:hypothetical protein